ncbi:MAG: hypothetical protein QT05_C0042G0004 [archaeon GW2011_AR13]|nr:MAG: hypothetical protein QT05_C0042G0004 [archaeon GW2011_AR13]HIG94606.1 hypothetical protein [Nanoarchaeota archaeon]HIH63345.1 hypothetical protein [Nanoarchaeota archaeon]HIJ09969.1 hypothetical protein [Nanoarchaeota archaeon]
MINNLKPLSMAEALEYIDDSEANAEISNFIQKFTTLKPKKAVELREKLEKLDIMKLKDESIVKIIDLMPETSEDLNKIFVGLNLDEDETKKILDIVKEFK